MISHKNKCIFLHIPKCAGTSIEMALEHHTVTERGTQDHRGLRMLEQPFPTLAAFRNLENMLESARRIKHRLSRHGHSNNSLTVNKEQYDSYFKFTFVRNPWSRIYSWYINVMMDEYHQRDYGVDNTISFPDFLKRFVGQDALATQLYWIKDMKGDIPMDFIGRFENLRDDYDEVCRRIGLENKDLPHETKAATKKRDYREIYDNETHDLVEKFYHEEIRLFGYTFDTQNDLGSIVLPQPA